MDAILLSFIGIGILTQVHFSLSGLLNEDYQEWTQALFFLLLAIVTMFGLLSMVFKYQLKKNGILTLGTNGFNDYYFTAGQLFEYHHVESVENWDGFLVIKFKPALTINYEFGRKSLNSRLMRQCKLSRKLSADNGLIYPKHLFGKDISQLIKETITAKNTPV